LGREKVRSVICDSRLAGPGAIFVALRGPARDGHDFIPQALAAGALAALARDGWRAPEAPEERLLRVEDTLIALGNLARGVRDQVGAKVLAVTGSVGKTTVKEMIGRVLEAASPPGSLTVSRGNFNNRIGLPLTLLSMGVGTKAAVVEMGANEFGEIEDLTLTARPDVGLVTGAGQAHLERFGRLSGVARAKGELYRGLGPGAVAVVNAEDVLMMAEARAFSGEKIYYGLESAEALGPGVRSVVLRRVDSRGLAGQRLMMSGPWKGGDMTVDLRIPGVHNAFNAAAAAAAALAMGAGTEAIRGGLESVEAAPGRLSVRPGRGGLQLLDDTYNANPTSVRAALGFLAGLEPTGGRGAILGDMLELGPESREHHIRIGLLASRCGLSWLALVGREAKHMAMGAFGGGLRPGEVALFDSAVEAARWVSVKAPANSVTLIKGSRSLGLELAVAELLGPEEGGGSGEDAV
jgi:UDP-N-acetylmuramoyl-tripeptide--D-alanyl-D-alanine ligase